MQTAKTILWRLTFVSAVILTVIAAAAMWDRLQAAFRLFCEAWPPTLVVVHYSLRIKHGRGLLFWVARCLDFFEAIEDGFIRTAKPMLRQYWSGVREAHREVKQEVAGV